MNRIGSKMVIKSTKSDRWVWKCMVERMCQTSKS